MGKAFKGAEPDAKKAGKAIGSSFSSGFTAVFGAVAFGQILRSSLGEADEAIKVGALTDAVLKSTGATAGVTAEDVAGLADELSRLAGVDDDVIQGAENVLLTFTKVRDVVGEGNDIFSQATRLALDLSVALGVDLQGSVIQLGKALNDPVKGVTALQRVGVSFTESQKDQIKALVKSNRLLDAQKIILAELQTEFGGAAEAGATPLGRFNVAVGELQETIGRGLTPLLEDLTGLLTSAVDLFERLPEPVRNAAVEVATLGLAIKAVNTFSRALLGVDLIRFFTNLAPAAAAAATSIELVGVAGTAAEVGLGGAALGIAGLAAPIVAAGVAAGFAINKIFELGETDNIKELAERDIESLIRGLKRVGAGKSELEGVADVFEKFRAEGKLTADTVDVVTQNLGFLLGVAKAGGDVVAAFTAVLNGDTKAIAEMSEFYGIATASTKGLTDATKALTDEQEKAADARKTLNRAIEDSERNVDRAEKRLTRAREDGARSVRRAEEDVAQAVEDRVDRIGDAEEKLKEIREGAADDVRDARRNLRDFERDSARDTAEAERRVAEARQERVRAIGDAQQSVEAAQRSGDLEAENAARQALQQAQTDRSVADAERDLAEQKKERGREGARLEEELADTRVVAADRVKDAEEDLADVVEDTAERIKAAKRSLRDAQREAAESIVDAEVAVEDAIRNGAEAVDDARTAFDRLGSEVEEARTGVQLLTNDVDLLAAALDKVASNPVFRFSDPVFPEGRAAGGDMFAGRPYITSEEGPELIIPSRNSTAVSNDQLVGVLREMMNGRSGPSVGPVHITAGNVDPRLLANELAFRLMQGVR